jgi:hypothetical protein
MALVLGTPGRVGTALTGWWDELHCTALHCTALHCTALHCTALHCTALHCCRAYIHTLAEWDGSKERKEEAPLDTKQLATICTYLAL